MRNLAFVILALFTLSSLVLLSCKEDDPSPLQDMKVDLENLSGTYMDLQPYAYGEAFGQRVFTFDQGQWTLTFTLGLDPNLEIPVFEFRTHGSYEVLEPSTTVENAFNAVFGEDQKFLTLKTDHPELIEAFGFTSCGLTPQVEKDISLDGCSLWKSVQDCPADYDLLSLDQQGRLYFGVRPADNDMCSVDKRPLALTPAVDKL